MTKFEESSFIAIIVSISKDEIETCSNKDELEKLIELHTRTAKKSLSENIAEKYPHLA